MEVVGIFRLDKTVEDGRLDETDQQSSHADKPCDIDCTGFDVDQNVIHEQTPGKDKPIWESTEDEQMKWALAESTKSAEKESRAKLNEQKSNKIKTECLEKSTAAVEAASFEDEDFNLVSDVSDEDLVNAAQDSGVDEGFGLKGGSPTITTTQNCSDELEINSMHDTSSNRNCSIDSGLEKSSCKEPVLKNSPTLCTKRPHSVGRKRKQQDNVQLSKTPTLGKFDGNLFEDGVKKNKAFANGVSHKDSPKNSWYSSSFRDDDMAKAINMSLQDQVRLR